MTDYTDLIAKLKELADRVDAAACDPASAFLLPDRDHIDRAVDAIQAQEAISRQSP